MGKSPAFQMYPADILSSPSCSLMSAEQFGAYVLLLLHSWMSEDCGIPADDEALGKLSRLGTEGWLKFGCPLVRDRFVKNGERLYNKRLLEEREKQKIWREKSAAGGRKSGQVRRKSKKTRQVSDIKGGSVLVRTKHEPNYEPNTNSSSSSSSVNKPPISPPNSEQVLLVQDVDPKMEIDRIFEAIKTGHPKGRNTAPTKALERFRAKCKRLETARVMLEHHEVWREVWATGQGCPDLFRWITNFDPAADFPKPAIQPSVKRSRTDETMAAWVAAAPEAE